ERVVPFNGRVEFNPGGPTLGTPGPQNHSLYGRTVAAATKNLANDWLLENYLTTNILDPTLLPFWQPHFDRDFSSAMELLSIPLYGNWGYDWDPGVPLTAGPEEERQGGASHNVVQMDTTGNDYWMSGHLTAQ